MTYRAPVKDIAFALKVVGFDAVAERHGEVDADLVEAVLEGAAQLAEGVLAPINRIGDTVGAKLENGRVVSPPGYIGAYKAFAEGGWTSLIADPEYGGQGLPKALSLAVFETFHAANMAFSLCPTLGEGAMEALAAHGSEELKTLYLPRMISGEWTATMNLTEPQAGSDLGLVRTLATPDGQGGYRLTGEKIFITWGDHDLTDNIVHLVLARLPDAPAGVKGISLFLAPARKLDADGKAGEHNALRAASLEHKLGIHASPTCVMLFEGAEAHLIGQPNQGLAHMFTMMNAARLNVGMQGVGIAERAYQQAYAYALDRRQSRSVWTGEAPAPIFDHPDIRRRLMLTKARIEAARMICLACAVAADLGQAGDAAAALRAEVLTPIAKAWSTELGVEAASEGIQVHGGMGFIEETGAAQHYRDARIAPIYEGTNAIQALDLAGRKLGMQDGAGLKALGAEIAGGLSGFDPALHEGLRSGVAALETATAWMLERRGSADAMAGAWAYLMLAGDVVGGWMLARAAAADPQRLGLATLYADYVLAAAPARLAAVQSGAALLEAWRG
jgi:alkylation response protein AidB-like acyl-CoA dehydrogenase